MRTAAAQRRIGVEAARPPAAAARFDRRLARALERARKIRPPSRTCSTWRFVAHLLGGVSAKVSAWGATGSRRSEVAWARYATLARATT